MIQDCFEFDGFLTSNGQYCFNHEVVIHEKYIEREDIRNLLPYINKNQIPVLFVEIMVIIVISKIIVLVKLLDH